MFLSVKEKESKNTYIFIFFPEVTANLVEELKHFQTVKSERQNIDDKSPENIRSSTK